MQRITSQFLSTASFNQFLEEIEHFSDVNYYQSTTMIGVKSFSIFFLLLAGAQSKPTIDIENSDVSANLTSNHPVLDLSLVEELDKTDAPLAPDTLETLTDAGTTKELVVSNVTNEGPHVKPILILLAAEPNAEAIDTKEEVIAETNGTKLEVIASTVMPSSVLNATDATDSRNKTYAQRVYDQLLPRQSGWTWYDVKMVAVIVIVVLILVCLCCACATLCVWCCDSDNSNKQPDHRRQGQQRLHAAGHHQQAGQHSQVAQQARGRTGRFGFGGQKKEQHPADNNVHMAYHTSSASSHQLTINPQSVVQVISQVLAVPEVQRILSGTTVSDVIEQVRSREPSPARRMPSIQQRPIVHNNPENDI